MKKESVQMTKDIYVVSDEKGSLEVVKKTGDEISLDEIYAKEEELKSAKNVLKKAEEDFIKINKLEKGRISSRIRSFFTVPCTTIIVSIPVIAMMGLTTNTIIEVICFAAGSFVGNRIYVRSKYGTKVDNIKKIDKAYLKKVNYERLVEELERQLIDIKTRVKFEVLSKRNDEKKSKKLVPDNNAVLDNDIKLNLKK